MSEVRSFLVCVFIFVISLYHAFSQDPRPIMHLDGPDNIGCLGNDNDFFTVRGNVSKNGANADAYIDTNLYLQAVKDPSTNAWASQCRPDLTICKKDLNTDCYCESKDADGYYHIVMNIMAKSLYSGGQLMLSWNDKRSPYNPPVTSNQVDYYPGLICDPINATLTTGTTETILDTDECPNEYKKLHLSHTPDMTNLTFCVYNLKATGFVQIAEKDEVLERTTTLPCVSISLNQSQSQVLTLSFSESGGCERTGSYNLSLGTDRSKPEPDSDLEDYIIVIIVISCVVVITVVVVTVTVKYCWLISCFYCCSCRCSMCETKIAHDDDKDSPSVLKSNLSIFTIKTHCLKGCTTTREVTLEKDKTKKQDGKQGKHRKDTVMAENNGTPKPLLSVSPSVLRSNNWQKSAISNGITMREKKKKKKMKGTETAHNEAIPKDKVNALDGSHGTRRVNTGTVGQNSSPQPRPLPPINTNVSMSYSERKSSILNEKNMAGVKRKWKTLTDTEPVHKEAIKKEKTNELKVSLRKQKVDVVMVGENLSPRLTPSAPTCDTTNMPNDEKMSAISSCPKL